MTRDDEEVLSSNLFRYSPAFSIYYSFAPMLGSAWETNQREIAVKLEHTGRIIHLKLDLDGGIMQDTWGIIGWLYFPTEDANPSLDYAFVIWNR